MNSGKRGRTIPGLPLILLFLICFHATGQAQNSCLDCHLELEGSLREPAEVFDTDLHRRAGLSCVSCHGGDPSTGDMDAAKDPRKGWKGVPSHSEIPAFCGSCHSSAEFMRQYDPAFRIDQVTEYRSSVHGQRAAAGDTRVATCNSCHPSHRIRPAVDPASSVHPLKVAETCGSCHSDVELMESYKIPADQVTQHRESVHGRALHEKGDLSAPTCNDCHGNHGAAPPGMASVTNVCGNCHGAQRDNFQKGPHQEMFELMDLGGCVACHGNHTVFSPDESLLSGPDAVCNQCHESDQGTETGQQMAEAILALSARIEEAQRVLADAEHAGVEVSEPIYDLVEARQHIIMARHQTHSMDAQEVRVITGAGLEVAEASYQSGLAAFQELGSRRRGLYGSLLAIILVVVGLISWIRTIEKEDKS